MRALRSSMPALQLSSPGEFFRYQFVRQPDLTSDLIALGGAGDFSHVDILLDDGSLLGARSDSVGGKPPGVQIRPADYVKDWTHQVVIAVPCVPAQKAAALDFAFKQLGKPYDKLAIAGFIVGRDWRSPDHWFCSELGARVGEAGGFFGEMYSPVNKIAPVTLSCVASAVPGRVITVIK